MSWLRRLLKRETGDEMRARVAESLQADRRRLFAIMILED